MSHTKTFKQFVKENNLIRLQKTRKTLNKPYLDKVSEYAKKGKKFYSRILLSKYIGDNFLQTAYTRIFNAVNTRQDLARKYNTRNTPQHNLVKQLEKRLFDEIEKFENSKEIKLALMPIKYSNKNYFPTNPTYGIN
ncbi:MAG: hypothetical protein H8D92_00715 [Pelagibacteraceae bacterium]|nr:hypothetical protein [Pelagibacteraceae bacterium]